MPFPKKFMWGTATSSYQIEGAALEDGRSECIWTRFSHTPGKVANGDTGDVACDHYHRYKDDIKLMRDIGVNAYRFSISWARVLPDGVGRQNQAGLDFYKRVIDELLAANIEPCATIYHWDMPQVLEDRGGWLSPDMVNWFAEYTDVVSKAFGDRVKDWITINEPWVVAFLGYLNGTFAPGIRDLASGYLAAHHTLLAHGAAVPIVRANVPDARVGITLNLNVTDPASPDPLDIQSTIRQDAYLNRWFLDPVFKGSYPLDFVNLLGEKVLKFDLSAIKAAAVPTDFLGVNYYTRNITAHDDSPPSGPDAEINAVLKLRQVRLPNGEYTTMGWEVYPDGLTRLLLRLHREYAPPAIYVTENGCALDDAQPQNGILEDPRRAAYFEGHIAAVEAALAQGVPMAGYFAWSFMDNFEWSSGYHQRFGLVHVDFKTQARTLKRSALTYQKIIAANS